MRQKSDCSFTNGYIMVKRKEYTRDIMIHIVGNSMMAVL